jgi:hypothetical protein
MDAKELRKEVTAFLLSKDENADTTQNTKVLIKRAVKLGFTEPESELEKEPESELEKEPESELEKEPESELEKETEKKVRKPREKKVIEIERKEAPVLTALLNEKRTVKEPEKSDNSIYWIIAIAVAGIALLLIIKNMNKNAKETDYTTE